MTNGEWGPHMRAMLGGPGTRGVEHQRIRRLFVIAAVALFVAAVGSGCGSKRRRPRRARRRPASRCRARRRPARALSTRSPGTLPGGEPTTPRPAQGGRLRPLFRELTAQRHAGAVLARLEARSGDRRIVDAARPLTIVYTIRQDAKFWDGNPVTVDDVIFSLKRNMDPKTGSIWIGLLQQRQEHHPDGTLGGHRQVQQARRALQQGDGHQRRRHRREGLRAEGRRGQVRLGHERDGQRALQARELEVGQRDRARGQPGLLGPSLRPKVQKVTLKFIADTSTITSALLVGRDRRRLRGAGDQHPGPQVGIERQALLRPQRLAVRGRISKPERAPWATPNCARRSRWRSTAGDRREGLQRRRPMPNKTIRRRRAWDPRR